MRFTATPASLDAYLCHCRMCQRATGNVSVALVNAAKVDVAWERPPDWYASSPIARRPFCATCGTSLGFEYLDSDKCDLTVASFDDPSPFRCTSHFGTESRLDAWWHGTDGLPETRCDEYPALRALWEKAGAEPPR